MTIGIEACVCRFMDNKKKKKGRKRTTRGGQGGEEEKNETRWWIDGIYIHVTARDSILEKKGLVRYSITSFRSISKVN